VVGSCTGRWPEEATCVHAAGCEGVTTGERAAGRPCEPSRLDLFALNDSQQVSLEDLSAARRYTTRYLALAMDASTLGQRFTLLSISVVVRGCAIPVAWRIVEATRAGAWRPHWEALFGHLQGSVPADWLVIVLADRGLYARWLFTTIQALGWHPFLRINRQGRYRLPTSTTFRPLSQVVSRVGQRWAGRVTCFTTPARQLTCTLLARWDAGYRDPWLILTDLPPTTVDVAWYALRAWIECGFKDSKRGGWHWEQTKMLAPARAERLWLAVAVATLWTVSVGCQAEVEQPQPQVRQLPERHIARKRATGQRPPRALSCFRRGRLVILAALCLGQPLPMGAILPELWPSRPRDYLGPAPYLSTAAQSGIREKPTLERSPSPPHPEALLWPREVGPLGSGRRSQAAGLVRSLAG